ncbi:MAG: hypothetical protein Ct9H300mP11_31160 [Chloroflexota bacterium]|nr:MAG: hypothetical protein Ct9H300mP11_31160 [Chloroflexota bacterium]
MYRASSIAAGHKPTKDNFGYLLAAMWLTAKRKPTSRLSISYGAWVKLQEGRGENMNPVGYRSVASQAVAGGRNAVPLGQQTFEELKENYHIVCGTQKPS